MRRVETKKDSSSGGKVEREKERERERERGREKEGREYTQVEKS